MGHDAAPESPQPARPHGDRDDATGVPFGATVPRDSPDCLEMMAGAGLVAVGWCAAVAMQLLAERLTYTLDAYDGIQPAGSGWRALAVVLGLGSLVVGLGIPVLGLSWLRRHRRAGAAPARPTATPWVREPKAAHDVKVSARSDGGTLCPFCRETFRRDADVMECQGCEARQHAECYRELGRCAVCGGAAGGARQQA